MSGPNPATPPDPKTDQDKLKFLGLVSHELKTPLNAIIGFSQMIESQAFGPIDKSEYVEFAAEIQQSGQALLRLVDELITAAQAENEGLIAEESHIDLGAAVADAVKHLEAAAKSKSIEVTVEGQNEASAIWADARMVAQAIGAVIDNAIKFTPVGGAVKVRLVRRSRGERRLIVEDTGPGFDADVKENLTGIFRQGDDRVARAHGGAGIGLYLCRRFLELHDGWIEIGTAPGGGASVALCFPRDRALTIHDEDDLTLMADDETITSGAKLLLVFDGKSYNVFSGGSEFTIGRGSSDASGDALNLTALDRRVSRAHGQIIWSDGAFYLVDASKRGSFVTIGGGPPTHVHMNVSPPLSGAGSITLGDSPEVEDAPTIRFNLTQAEEANE